MRKLAMVLVTASFALPAAAQEKTVELKNASGRDKVESNCSGCHSLDYIPMNSPFLDAATWNAEITKMIRAFGAPVSDDDAKTITEYLTKNYGTE
jgi:sulfite dehydrogenase (cytochrome) subunit B